MSDETIDRDVGNKSRGFRLQRLRAVKLILAAAHESSDRLVTCALECGADVRLDTQTDSETTSYREEDKNYSATGRFTIASQAVRQSLIAFADQYLKYVGSDELRFGFYATPDIGKERKAGLVKELTLSLPKKPIIKLLDEGDFSDPNTLKVVRAVTLAEYAAQYASRPSNGYLGDLEDWHPDEWIRFLSLVDWQLGSADESELEKELVRDVRSSRLFESALEGREDILISTLADLFDRKQGSDDLVVKQVSAARVEVLFMRVAGRQQLLEDSS